MNKKTMIISLSLVVIAVLGIFIYHYMTRVEVREVDLSVQEAKISEYANHNAFVTAEQLKAMLDDTSLDVVAIGTMDARGGVIPGSFQVWRPDYSGTDVYEFGGMANSKEEMEQLFSQFGVTPETTIVTYAAQDQHDSARLFWQAKMLGHEDVRLLDGGINVWIGAGYETGNPLTIGDRPETNYEAPNFNESGFNAKLDVVTDAVDNDDYIILDTRSESEEDGSTTLSGAFGPGKIKGSVFIEYSKATTEEGTIKPRAELEELYRDVVSSDKQVIAYCQSGVRSSYTWLILTEVLGYENALNYDGSWIEWSYEVYEKDNDKITQLTENNN
ncbi:rhodanese-like domain-containing protein [Bacillaceae bacterium IKA-2]|nr:rhodanese-like domain-containing protein [Bacillaceae bacterium IKA-2]